MAVAPQPVAYPPLLDFGLVQRGDKRTLLLQIGNLGGPGTNLQVRCRESHSPFRISKGKAAYTDRPFPVNYEISIDTQRLASNSTHRAWLEVNLDGMLTHVELRLQIGAARQRRLHARLQPHLPKRWLTGVLIAILAMLLVGAIVATVPTFTALPALPRFTLPSFFARSLHDLQTTDLLFAVGESGTPTVYVGGHGGSQPKGLGISGRGAVGSTASQQVAYLGVDHEVHLLALGSGQQQTVTHDGEAKAALSWSPDGSRVAYLVGAGASQRIGVYVVASGEESYLPGAVTTGVSHYAWSPDGQVLLFDLWQGQERRVYRIGVDGSGLQQLTHFDSWGGAWSADGRSLVVSSAQGLHRLDSQGRTVTQVSAVVGEAPSWSADGKWLAYLTTAAERQGQMLWLLEVASGQAEVVASESVSYRWSPTGALLGYVTGRARGETPLLYLWTLTPGAQPTLVAEVNDPLFQWIK
ncbi:PD40 domain-containing protein [candidate division KSB1 bacterium]|nr:PD40 domain-containing protein [candidate division KSB1 bacterium]